MAPEQNNRPIFAGFARQPRKQGKLPRVCPVTKDTKHARGCGCQVTIGGKLIVRGSNTMRTEA